MLDSSYFTYDAEAPLTLIVLAERIENGTCIQDITYASPRGGKVPAYVIGPADQVPQAGLIFGHWGEGNREEFVAEATLLAHLGIVSLCLDNPFRRPEEYKPQVGEPLQAELQWIADVRRGVDLLREHGHVPAEKIGYVGHSFSATYGGALAGNERRIKAYVLMAGYYSLTEAMRTSNQSLIVQMRDSAPPEEFAAYLDAVAPLDAIHYIGQTTPAHLFFQYARNDEYVTIAEGQHYFELASEPKQLAWYDNCGHEFNGKARVDRVLFFCEQFNLTRPSTELLNQFEGLPAPIPLPDQDD